MNRIRILPEIVVNQIAAGEIVERPASVIKELIENSIDAGARTIKVEIESGGRKLMRVLDDGCGMSRNDAILAFERHATSKIKTLADLTSIKTLGFRGEALSSIASVSRVELVTKSEENLTATKVVIEGGKIVDVKDTARPEGTTVTVKDLFFNTPARRKFMRSEATENYHITAVFQQYALAYPELSFSLANNGREIFNLPAAKSLIERIFQIFGSSLTESLLLVSEENESLAKVSGYISAPHERRSTRQDQYFFVNRRFVRDKVIASAVSEAFRSILPENTHPVAFLFLEMLPEEVDVNVHPAKIEVRFRRKEAVKQTVVDAIAKALKTPSHSEKKARIISLKPYKDKPTASPEEIQNLMVFSPESSKSFEEFHSEPQRKEIPDHQIERKESFFKPSSVKSPILETLQVLPSASRFLKTIEAEINLSKITPITPIYQIKASYIVAVDEKGLLLIDQHVAHERILFEKFREKDRKIQTQNLLVPETIDLTPSESQILQLIEKELENMGFVIMPLSGRTIVIKGIPNEIPPSELRNIISDILRMTEDDLKNPRAKLRDQIAAKLACKAAIKVNTPLSQEKMQWLVDMLFQTSSPYTCPHGRPIVLRLSVGDIEKGFHRK